jgi:hypothetical protein
MDGNYSLIFVREGTDSGEGKRIFEIFFTHPVLQGRDERKMGEDE